jgi:hypothetical protein
MERSPEEVRKTTAYFNLLHGICDVSYSITSYSRPHFRQPVHGALFGFSSYGIDALRLSSAIASSKLWYVPCLSQ